MDTKQINCGLSLKGKITAISSKSDLHRLIICGCLSDNGCKIGYKAQLSNDITATISCLTSLGARITVSEDFISIDKPIDRNNMPKNPVLNCGESGSTARFLLPVVAILAKGATLIGEGKLPLRPFEPLCDALAEMGAVFSDNRLPITVKETAKPHGFYNIKGNISSQFITGLLFTLPLCDAEGIRLTTELESFGYVNLTLDAMTRFGIDVKYINNTYTITGSYVSPKGILHAQGDWSNAAFWLCGATNAPITVTGLDLYSSQPDREICSILSSMGMEITYGNDSVTAISPDGTKGISFDGRNIPDIVPILAVRAAISTGDTTISGIGRLRIKESDRVKAVCDLINGLGGSATSDDEHIYIKGKAKLSGGTVDSYNDHRIAMSGAIAAIFCEHPVEIINPNSAYKSYPQFYSHYNMLTENLN